MKKKVSVLCFLAVAGIFATPAEAIYKCATAKGVVYQDRPCREGTESDVQIVIPTGELAPKNGPATDEAMQPGAGRGESYFGQRKASRSGADDPALAGKGAAAKGSDKEANGANADTRSRNDRAPESRSTPMTMDQAQRTDPSGKYYTTDTSASGVEMPEQMTCESPSGEKRRFILTNGKMTSI